ncbi:unnamed protein product, partial [Didymodactylos carnosus]
CTQRRQLAELFSTAVDASKTGEVIRIPPHLKPPQPQTQLLTQTPPSTTTNELDANEKTKEFVWVKM